MGFFRPEGLLFLLLMVGTSLAQNCEWAQFQVCSQYFTGLEVQNGNFTEMCTRMNTGVKCMEDLKEGCSDAGILNAIEQTKNGIQQHIASCDFDSACNWPIFQKCTMSMAGLEKEVNRDILCPKLFEGDRCLRDLGSKCTSAEAPILTAINQTFSAMQTGQQYCAAYTPTPVTVADSPHPYTSSPKSTSVAQNCEWTQFQVCSQYFTGLETQNANLTNTCTRLNTGVKCMEDLKEGCSDTGILGAIQQTMNGIQPHRASCDFDSACNWPIFQKCTLPMAGLEKEENRDILCPKLWEGDRCLRDLGSKCTSAEAPILTAINQTVSAMQTGLQYCASYTPTPVTAADSPNPYTSSPKSTSVAQNCEWTQFQVCSQYFTGLETQNANLTNTCTRLNTGVKCMEDLKEGCSDTGILGAIQQTMNGIQPHRASCDFDSACNWPIFQKCTLPMAGLEKEENRDILCPKLWEGNRCLRDLGSKCTSAEAPILTAINQTVSAMQTGLQYCASYTPTPVTAADSPNPYTSSPKPSHMCTTEKIEKCWATYKMYSGDMTKQCRDMTVTKNCLLKLHANCDHPENKQNIQMNHVPSVEKEIRECMAYGYKTYYDVCSWTKYQECVAVMSGLEGGEPNRDILCPKMWKGGACLHGLISNCTNESILLSVNQTFSAMQTGLQYCDGYTPTGHPDKYTTTPTSSHMCTKKKIEGCWKYHKMYPGDYAKQCRYSNVTQNCLLKLHANCDHPDNKEHIRMNQLPMLQKQMNDCMKYGYQTYHDKCLWTGLQECVNVMTGLEGEVNRDKLCPNLWKGEYCLHGLVSNCTDAGILASINTTLKAMQTGLQYCMGYEPSHSLTTKHMYTTTSKPYYMCTEDKIEQCWASYQMHDGDMVGQCRETNNTRACLVQLHMMCDHAVNKDHIRNKAMPAIDRKMTECINSGHKTYKDYYMCTKEKMDACWEDYKSHTGDMAGQCREINETRTCLMDLHGSCDHFDNKRRIQNEHLPALERNAKECTDRGHPINKYQMHCTRYRIQECWTDFRRHSYDMPRQCRESEGVKKCLENLHGSCDNYNENKQNIQYQEIPNATAMINKCMMYGHPTSWDSAGNGDGYAAGFGVAQTQSENSLVAFLLLAVAMVYAMRF